MLLVSKSVSSVVRLEFSAPATVTVVEAELSAGLASVTEELTEAFAT